MRSHHIDGISVNDSKLSYDDHHKINCIKDFISSAQSVIDELREGHSEAVYHTALETEFRLRNIPYESEFPIQITYKNHSIGSYRVDLKSLDIIIELKAIKSISYDAIQQLKNYLRYMNLRHGVVINFPQVRNPENNLIEYVIVIGDDIVNLN